MTVAAYVPDLMDRSRVSAAAGTVGVTVVFVPGLDKVPSDADLVLVDLARPGAVDGLGGLDGRHSVGFASHVDRDLIKRAKAAGCDEVLARSAFFSRLGRILAPEKS